jgi:hypothetical protein
MIGKKTNTLSELFSETVNPQKKHNSLKIAQDIFLNLKKLDSSMEEVTILINSFKEIKKPKNSLVAASTFLFVFEGLYVTCLNSIIYLLVCYCHDLYDPLRSYHYANSPERIANVDLELKFRFLEKHGFQSVVLRDCQTIRNKIAHNDFRLSKGSSKIILVLRDGNGKAHEKEYDMVIELISLLDFSANLLQEYEKLVNSLP